MQNRTEATHLMKDIPPQSKRSEIGTRISGQGNVAASAQLSLATITLLEILSTIISVILINWAIVPIYPQSHWPLIAPTFLIISFIIYSQIKRGESWKDLGFSRNHFGTALRFLLLPVTLGCTILFTIGYFTNSIHRSTHLGTNLLIIPFWGIVQQYVLQGFLYRRIRSLFSLLPYCSAAHSQRVWLAILLTAGLFAAVHLPNLTLASLTLLAAIVWTWVYERAPNLWALGLSHGLLSLVLMHSLPLRFLHSMSIGYKHFLYQKF